MTINKVLQVLRTEHLVTEGIWQNERIETLLKSYGDYRAFEATRQLLRGQSLVESQRPKLPAPEKRPTDPVPFRDDTGNVQMGKRGDPVSFPLTDDARDAMRANAQPFNPGQQLAMSGDDYGHAPRMGSVGPRRSTPNADQTNDDQDHPSPYPSTAAPDEGSVAPNPPLSERSPFKDSDAPGPKPTPTPDPFGMPAGDEEQKVPSTPEFDEFDHHVDTPHPPPAAHDPYERPPWQEQSPSA